MPANGLQCSESEHSRQLLSRKSEPGPRSLQPFAERHRSWPPVITKERDCLRDEMEIGFSLVQLPPGVGRHGNTDSFRRPALLQLQRPPTFAESRTESAGGNHDLLSVPVHRFRSLQRHWQKGKQRGRVSAGGRCGEAVDLESVTSARSSQLSGKSPRPPASCQLPAAS